MYDNFDFPFILIIPCLTLQTKELQKALDDNEALKAQAEGTLMIILPLSAIVYYCIMYYCTKCNLVQVLFSLHFNKFVG